VGVEVKICGLTRSVDAAVAVGAGASYLGVVYAGGPRLVSDATAQRVVAAAGTRPVLGVFDRQDADEILRIRDATGICGAQLHGPHEAERARRLRGEGLLVWRVLRVESAADLVALDALAEDADAVLVEPRVPRVQGGAGIPLALELGRQARGRLRAQRMVLAGGLRPETVAAAAAFVKPDVVDVSSGVEIAPGIKDPVSMRRFMEAVRGHQFTA
jgi:phosphoribosylanthranilate isomerase